MWFKRRKRARQEIIEQATAAPGEKRWLPPKGRIYYHPPCGLSGCALCGDDE